MTTTSLSKKEKPSDNNNHEKLLIILVLGYLCFSLANASIMYDEWNGLSQACYIIGSLFCIVALLLPDYDEN